MTRYIKNIVNGIGSVVDIMPKNSFNQYVPKQDLGDRMGAHWIKAGNSISIAIGQLRIDTKKSPKKNR